MLLVFSLLLGGIVTGRLLKSGCLVFVRRAIPVIVWALLFLLGLEVGSDPAVVRGLATAGRTAFLIFALSTAGSIAAAWLLERRIRARGALPAPDDAAGASAGGQLRDALRGSLTIVLFFVAGCVVGAAGLAPSGVRDCGAGLWTLYVLMFSVGISLGGDRTLVPRIRQLDPRFALLPLATAAGTLLGAAAAAPAVDAVSLSDSLAVGAGFGYYSLSSVFIADLRSAELGTVALLCNVMREIFTLVAAPLVARRFGPLAAVSIGGATSFDTTLSVITQSAGRPYAVVSVFHGCVLDFSVPFLVTLFCSI